jgi:Ni,Fe-hydrogenase III large subunit
MIVLHSGETLALEEIPVLPIDALRARVVEEVARGARIAALFGTPRSAGVRLVAVLAHPRSATWSVAFADVGERYPALTPDCPQAHWFEREIAEAWGVVPDGHPWLKPIRFIRGGLPGVAEPFEVEGEEVHEVAVGPVHAGVIEPGHFRFQCHGERVLHLEISLGYQHRGVERALLGGPNKRTIHYMETLAGDTSAGHATAYAQVVEALSRCQVPPRAEALRAVALEIERLANHCGDLGALAGDVGYLPTASFCGRIRGDYLNATALLCGSRFGRGMVRPGGVGFDLEEARVQDLLTRLERALTDARGAADLLWESPSVLARFEGAGPLAREVAVDVGIVGVAARACGIERDARHEFPSGLYRFFQVPVSTWESGDVFARAYVRWLEMQQSTAFLRDALAALPGGGVRAEVGPLGKGRLAVSMVEGWRGEICHVALTDGEGRFAAYKVVDPSFHNWMGLAMALRDQEISDFPLCNKSFNLSYCGHDL